MSTLIKKHGHRLSKINQKCNTPSELDRNTSYKLYEAEIKMKTSFFRISYHSSENLKNIFRIKWRMIFLSN